METAVNTVTLNVCWDVNSHPSATVRIMIDEIKKNIRTNSEKNIVQ